MPKQSIEEKRARNREKMRRFRAAHPGYHRRFAEQQRAYREENRGRMRPIAAEKARAQRAANRPPPGPNLLREEWRDIAGFEGLYSVSDLGRVRSMKYGHILRPYRSGAGYLGIALWRNRRAFRHAIHRLVAGAFLDTPAAGMGDVNHIDGAKQNNARINLEWVTHKENIQHAIRTGLIQTRKQRIS